MRKETHLGEAPAETIRDSERFRKIFEHSNDAIFIIDPERDAILDANDRAASMLGYSRGELLTLVISAVHPHEMPRFLSFTRSVLCSVLLRRCVQCHDLRTVLLRPRTPANWVRTVTRMADRSVFTPITEPQQWAVATYLIAITPTLQRGIRRRVEEDERVALAQATARAAAAELTAAGAAPSLGTGKEALQRLCTQCHGLENVQNAPPQSAAEARALVLRMVGNCLQATQPELEAIMAYLTATYAR